MLRSVLTRRRRRTWPPALALAIGAGILAGCSTPPKADRTTTTTTSSVAPPTSARTTTSSTPPPTTAPVRSKQAVAAAWEASFNAFYEAAENDDPNSPTLLATLYPDSPEFRQESGFLGSIALAGVVGPSSWRIGNVLVLSMARTQALVSACSYDAGTHYRSTGAEAPSDLGGGAGLTAYRTTLRRQGTTWLVYQTNVTFPKATTETGPCHGF